MIMFNPLTNYRAKNPFTVLHNPDNIPNIVRVFYATTNGQARLHTDLLPYYAISVQVREDHITMFAYVATSFRQSSFISFLTTTRPHRFVAPQPLK